MASVIPCANSQPQGLMSFRRRLFVSLFLALFLQSVLAGFWVRNELREKYAFLIEANLKKAADSFSYLVQTDSFDRIDVQSFQEGWDKYRKKMMETEEPVYEVYITDQFGRVLFSSRNSEEIGKDYSRWNDVYRTLRGRYGTRTTKNPDIPFTSDYYVAAPIESNDQIVGVLSVIEPNVQVNPMLMSTIKQISLGLGIIGLMMILLSFSTVMWITQPLDQIQEYCIKVSQGRKPRPLKLNVPELQQLAESFSKMRESLEGKKHVERYTQLLTHEMKSPLSSILISSELCMDPLDETERKKFLTNIITETKRSLGLLENLLSLARVESLEALREPKQFYLHEVFERLENDMKFVLSSKEVELELELKDEVKMVGDFELVYLALRNLVENATDFSSAGGKVTISAEKNPGTAGITIKVTDQGSGIPKYALHRVFDRFYSLERPGSGRKGSGLGLNLVREIVELHSGQISIQSPPDDFDHGTEVTIQI